MKKITLLFAGLMLLLAVPAKAQLSVPDLLGTWKFTAEMTLTDAGKKDYADKFKSECEVVIATGKPHPVIISGFAGADYDLPVSTVSSTDNQLVIKNPGGANYGIWSGYVALANANGDFPFSIWDSATQTSIEGWETAFTYNTDTKEIEIPDFTVVKADFSTSTATLLATFKNAKMTLLQAENVEVPDLSGDWTFTAGSGTYDTDKESSIPTEFAVVLEKNGDDNKAYSATWSIDGFDNFTIPATFDGITLAMEFDSTVVYESESDTIRLNYLYGNVKKGVIQFAYQNDALLTLSNGFSFVSDTVVYKENSDTHEMEPVNTVETKQWYSAGALKKATEGGDATGFSWEGEYLFTAETVSISDEANDYPATFDMTISYFDGSVYDMDSYYYISKFLGTDISQNFIKLNIAEDGNSAEMIAGGKCRYLGTSDTGAYLYNVLYDMNATTSPVAMTVQEDGTISIANFFLKLLTRSYPNADAGDWNTVEEAETAAAFYQNVTISKKVKEVFDWAGDYTVTAASASNNYLTEFPLTVTYYESQASYMVTSIMGKDVAGLNNGGLLLTVSEDGQSAELKLNGGYGYAIIESLGGGYYSVLLDGDGSNNSVTLTVTDGVVTIPDFKVGKAVWGESLTYDGEVLSNYSGVTAVKSDASTGIEDVKTENSVVKGIYDLSGRRIDAITAPGIYIVDGVKMLVK